MRICRRQPAAVRRASLVTPLTRKRSNLLTKLNTLARRHAKEVGRAPNDIVLRFLHRPVDINNFPHHFNDSSAPLVVESGIELTSEMVEINRATFGRHSVAN